jgi:hypothetical protein
MPPAAAIRVEGLREFRRELRAIDRTNGDRAWSRELTRTHRELGQMVASLSSGAAAGMGGSQAHFAGAIRGRGTAASARIGVLPRANAAFWGAKKRTGWYGAPRYAESTGQQHLPWVGTGWTAGGPGGPYAINATVRDNLRGIERAYAEAIDRVTRRAFPS